MTIATVTELIKAVRRTKLYDLFAAAPLIAWYVFCAGQMLPSVTHQIALVRLFIHTDPSVLPVGLVLSTVSHITTLAFFTVLIVMFTLRRVPQGAAPGFYPRCAALAGTFLSVGMLLLPLQELASALYLASLFLIISGTVFAICAALALGRSISILPEARRTRNLGTICLRSPPTLPWRDRRHGWSCAAVPVGMGANAAGAAMRIPTSADEKRRKGAISSFSRIQSLHGADSPLGAGRILDRISVKRASEQACQQHCRREATNRLFEPAARKGPAHGRPNSILFFIVNLWGARTLTYKGAASG